LPEHTPTCACLSETITRYTKTKKGGMSQKQSFVRPSLSGGNISSMLFGSQTGGENNKQNKFVFSSKEDFLCDKYYQKYLKYKKKYLNIKNLNI
jgi:hypothetical protein